MPDHTYEVQTDFVPKGGVGKVAPWFGYGGGGTQVYLGRDGVRDLIASGILKEV